MIIIVCPHCSCNVEIEQVNCKIFRHGADKNMHQIPPHSNEQTCKKTTVHGCGKPFRILQNESKEWVAEVCGFDT